MAIAQLDVQPALIDQVHDRLLEAIIDGTLSPGRRLTQDELAEMLGVSRQPVSHAIQVLRRSGLLVDSGKRGIAVAPIDARRIRDLYQVRAALDGLAAELASACVRSGAYDREALATLRHALDAGTRRLDDGDMSTLVDADVDFHSALHRLSGNAAIVETVAEQWPHFRRSMRRVLEASATADDTPPGLARDVAVRVWREHAEIFEAIVLGRASDAGRLARDHAIRAADDTAQRLAASPKPQAKPTRKGTTP